MPKAEPFECPRCNYTTQIKRDMHKHLYLLKGLCANIKNLELTEEIKQCVLKSKIYHNTPTSISHTPSTIDSESRYNSNRSVNEKTKRNVSNITKKNGGFKSKLEMW